MPYLALFLILIFATSTDSYGQDDVRVEIAETILYQKPDSARFLLKDFIRENNGLSETDYAHYLRQIGISFDLQNEYDSALSYFRQSLKYAKSAGDKSLIARALNSIGVVYFNKSDYSQSYEYYQLTLNEATALKDTLLMAKTLSNIGHIYFYQNELEESRAYYEKSLELGRLIKNPDIISNNYQNIANIDYTERNLEKAISDYLKSLKIDEEQGNDYRAAYTLTGLAMISKEVEDLDGAINYFQRSLAIRKRMNDLSGICNVYVNLSVTFQIKEELDSALFYAQKALSLAREITNIEAETQANQNLAVVYTARKEWEKATEAYQEYIIDRDSLYSLEKRDQIRELEKKYESERKSYEIRALQNEKKIQQEEIQIKDLQLELLSAGLLALALIGFFGYRSYASNKQVKNLLQQQNLAMEENKMILEKRNKEFTDSLSYAKNIQLSLLTPAETVKKLLGDHFIFYRAKDLVSGDFYWMDKKNGSTYIAVIDCTGHGVPGAMISVMAHNCINRVFREFETQNAGEFLNKLDEVFTRDLESRDRNIQDGMDISICIIDDLRKTIDLAGANHTALIIDGNEHREVKFNRQPIGPYDKKEPFESHFIEVKPGQELFMFTDGYADQFGGKEGKKFYYKNFKTILLDIAVYSTIEQYKRLQSNYEKWSEGQEQTDDVLVMGIKF